MKTVTYARCASSFVASTMALFVAQSPAAAQVTETEEPWFFAFEGLVSGPLNDTPRDQFGVGGGGTIGLYRSFVPELSVGLRLGAGALSGSGPVPQDSVDRGALDWGSLSATMRVRPLGSHDRDRRASGLWLEIGAGPWLVEGWVDPVFDAGVGYGIDLGPVVLSPLVRLTHVVEAHGRYGGEPIIIGNAGVEIAWNDRVARPSAGPSDTETPGLTREALPPEEDVAVPFVNDQLIIDERVFFDYDSSDLRPTGIAQLEEVVRRYEESGDRWQALMVSGHADRRGPPAYNVDLGRKRAEAVRDFLTARGVPADVLELVSWGEERPQIPDAETEWEHQVNRRVQFDIVWRPGMRPDGVPPVPRPTPPDDVDPAPEDRRDLP